jgi:hypothetical protein
MNINKRGQRENAAGDEERMASNCPLFFLTEEAN